MKRWLAVVPLIVLVALAVLFVGWSLRRDPAYQPDAMVGKAVPAMTLPVLTNGTAGPGQADLVTAAAGQPAVVNIFASWCAPCRIEHPQLMALREQGVRVIGVAYKDDPVATAAFLEELGDPFAVVLVDADGRLGLELGSSGVPETFAVDPWGTITAKHSGPLVDQADLDRLTEGLAPGRWSR